MVATTMVAGLMMVEDLMEVTLVEVIWTLAEISDHPNLFLYLVSINMCVNKYVYFVSH